MTPKILFIGGEKGSWEVRGRQIGKALGGICTIRPTAADFQRADAVILIKRSIDRWGDEAIRSGLPVLWDALDFWHQPQENHWDRFACIADAVRRRAGLSGIIGATKAMARDLDGIYIPHHSRPGLAPTPPRKQFYTVAYEGTPKYLGAWGRAIERACASLGARFIINPKSLANADVVVAFRGDPWDGWACRQWKSGVKYVNALVAGRPIMTQASAAFDEIKPVGIVIEQPDRVAEAIQAAWEKRREAYTLGLKRRGEFALHTIAKQYRSVIHRLVECAA